MSIEAEITVTLASVEVTDDYQVELRTRRKGTSFTPDEAVQLADELVRAATAATVALQEDMLERARHTMTHGFDIDAPRAGA